MRRVALVSIGILFLSACSPLSLYYKEGADVSRMQSDLLDCRVEALDQAPVSSQLRQGPPRYVPSYGYCHDGRSCYRRGGYFVPGEVYTVDVNASLRRQLEMRCMSGQGYGLVELENCPAGTRPEGGITQTETLPRLSENSCAIRGDNGVWQIVDLG